MESTVLTGLTVLNVQKTRVWARAHLELSTTFTTYLCIQLVLALFNRPASDHLKFNYP